MLWGGVASLLLAGCAVERPVIRPQDSCYFSVVQEDGAWWFVDGAGRRLLSLGVNAVFAKEINYLSGGAPYERAYDGPAQFAGDRAAWMADTAGRLKAWGFTMLGAWCEGGLAASGGLPETRCAWLGGYRSSPDMRLVDVWDPAYAGLIEQHAREQIAPHAADASIVGFFVNNELPWYGAHGWPSGTRDSLVARYMDLPAEAPGKQRLAGFLEAFYATNWTALARDWRIDAQGFAEVPAVRSIAPRDPRHLLAVEAWAGEVAERYFQLTDDALRRHAPRHLNLGARFAGRPYAPVLAACARHVDVVSLNDYAPGGQFNERVMDAIAALVQKPILITEMSWRATENQSGCPNDGGAPVTVATQKDRAEAFRRYTEAALGRPYVVGYHWFCWADQPPGGRFDGEDSNYGMVDIEGAPYVLLTEAMREVNQRAPSLHAAGSSLVPQPEPEVLSAYRVPALSPGPPATERVCLSMDGARAQAWSDASFPASVHVGGAEGRLGIRLADVRGWGGGLTLPPPEGAVLLEDGSYALSGARWLKVDVEAPEGLRFRVVLNESGVAPPGAQAYHGLGGADGESYVSEEQVAQAGRHQYEVHLQSLALNLAHGNGRGNHVIDLGFVRNVDVLFAAGQADAEAVLHACCFAP